jgi:restriction system protein
MTKRYSFSRQFSRALVKGAAQSRRSAAARQRAASAAAKRVDREEKRLERARLISQAEDARAQRQAYLESRQEETDDLNSDLEETIEAITDLLSEAVNKGDWALEFETLKRTPEVPTFRANGHDKPIPKPRPEDFRVARNPLARLLPPMRRKQEKAERVARRRLDTELERHAEAEKQRLARLDALRQEHDVVAERARKEADEHNQEVDAFRNQYQAGDPEAVVRYFTAILESDDPLDGLPSDLKLAFVPDSRQLVVERDLPTMDFVPTVGSHRYVKAHDRIETTARPTKNRQALYGSLISQLALRTLHIVLAADTAKSVDTIVFSGFVSTIDPATGKHTRPCLITLRTSRDTLAEIDFARVDPVACLGRLNAHVSRSPAELLPVRPIVDFNMVDKRFVESTDVLGGLEERPNLMELTPGEFENLITNLFEKLGLQTRLTRASRDGGVDCVGWDLHPITGGKVIIQAKRYKHTVGVSAVRDLFGTVHNEGAGKGILVTTSRYGKAAYDFAENKPLELLTGSNLLSLLEEHAGIRARIAMPEDWKDPVPDIEEPFSMPDPAGGAAAAAQEPRSSLPL